MRRHGRPLLSTLIVNEAGQDVVEYGLILATIAVVVLIGTATTKEMPVASRPATLPPEAFVLTSSIPSDDAARRRSRGTLIAMLLLLVMLVAAMWWVYRTAERVIGPPWATTPPATQTTPASP